MRDVIDQVKFEQSTLNQAMFDAAMRGELGPLAQAVAKYQMERKLQREPGKSEKTGGKLKDSVIEGASGNKVKSIVLLFSLRA